MKYIGVFDFFEFWGHKNEGIGIIAENGEVINIHKYSLPYYGIDNTLSSRDSMS